MSLKAFHIIFILSAIALDLGFGILSFKTYITNSSPAYLAMGLLSFVFGIALLVYVSGFFKN